MSLEANRSFQQEFNQGSSSVKKSGYFTSSDLVIFAFATAFFPRVLAGLGIPTAINFLHFIVVPLVCFYVLRQARFKDSRQWTIVKNILIGLFLLLTVMLLSAIVNSAGIINVFLDYMLLAEPFMLLLAVICISMSPESIEKFKIRWLNFSLINLLFALCQILVLRLNNQNADLIKGVFVEQASGHVVGASVSMAFAVYYFIIAKNRSIWIRFAIAFATLFHIVKADAKQVLAVFILAFVLLIFLKSNSVIQFLQYIFLVIIFTAVIILLANTVFRALLIWADFDVQIEGMRLKFSPFTILPTFYNSPLNWLIGLGPGHTIGRLGGWMVWEYKSLLGPIGLTTSRASVAVWNAANSSWLGNKSSWFSPLFGWAGIWGDLGLAGLGTYLYLWWTVWQKACLNDLSKFFTLTILVYGLIMSQIEEPGYMLYMTGIIALCWQTQQLKSSSPVSR
jgi:hypothetical protein